MTGKPLRLLLLVAMTGGIGFVVYSVIRGLDPSSPYVEAEASYESARRHEVRGEFKDAVADYDRTLELLRDAQTRSDWRQRLTAEQTNDVAGKIFYLRAKALRDMQYTLAAADGKPLPLTTDSVTREEYRGFHQIPPGKDRDDTADSLYTAALYGSKNYEIQFDALRQALVVAPINWDNVEKFCKAILAIRPDDTRAKFLLATMDFEQIDSTGRPAAKRSRDRLKNAALLVEEVRADSKFPVWRAERLRAAVHESLMKSAPDTKARIEELEKLESNLLEPKRGAIARIGLGEGLTNLTYWDREAVLTLFAMAADVALEGQRYQRPTHEDEARRDYLSVPKVYDDLLAFCVAKERQGDAAFPRPVVARQLVEVMIACQSALAAKSSQAWQDGLEFARASFRAEFAACRFDPEQVARFAELLLREANLRRSDASQARLLRTEAKTLLANAIALGKTQNLTELQMFPVNLRAANVAFLLGDSRESVAPLLKDLERTALPIGTASSLAIDGAFDEREGRLAQAREKFERAVLVVHGEEDLRCRAPLANVYFALGRPEYAVVDLLKLQDVYKTHDKLSLPEKEWLAYYLRGPDEARALLAVASLDAARRALAENVSNAAEKTNDLAKVHEDRVLALLKDELKSPQTPPGLVAHAAWINHLAVTDRAKEANDKWRTLNAAVPDRLEVLRLKIDQIDRDSADADAKKRRAAIADADKLIVAFVTDHPANQTARIYYALWLAHTRRLEQAVATLKTLADEPGATPETRRRIAHFLPMLDPESCPRVFRHLPRDPRIDKVLFDLVPQSIDAKGEVAGSLVRPDAVAFTRILQANALNAAGDHAKAVAAFTPLLDFPRVKPLVDQGLLRSIAPLADRDPQAARAAAQALLVDFPNDPATWLAKAYVHLARKEIGSPDDDWERTRTMASALNVWERHLTDLQPKVLPIDTQIAVLLTRAEFWLLADRPDLALPLADRATTKAGNLPLTDENRNQLITEANEVRTRAAEKGPDVPR